MTVKTQLTLGKISEVLSRYAEGGLTQATPIAEGTVQTNYLVETTRCRMVLRYYEGRSRESVLFETELLTYLTAHGYPCPAPIADRDGTVVGALRGKPLVLYRYIEGHHVEHPNTEQRRQLIRKVAELQVLGKGFSSPYTPYRWNYTRDLCRRLALKAAQRTSSADAMRKYLWLDQTLASLDLPDDHPLGVCHCDFYYANVLFQGDRFVALLDFDDANITYPQFDLVGLIEYGAWPHTSDLLDLAAARDIVRVYSAHRELAEVERAHLFDVYRLSILFDCVWFFKRGSAGDFYERRKIQALNNLGRDRFREALFGTAA